MAKTQSKIGWKFDNSYTTLPDKFFVRINPTPVADPKFAIFNDELAKELGLDPQGIDAASLSGNSIPQGAEPIAQAYAGHQFAHFTMLGDGRANLLGEHITKTGERFDIQLKGSGPTPFARRGDGRAALAPMLREYIISEAMHALGIPTTRSLAVTTTGETVDRETKQPGGILTRVAASHIRVGTFEYASALQDVAALRSLADYTIQRHYPDLTDHKEKYLAFLYAAIDRQASLIAKWMHVGFIHGVMNTDNMAISGETIDYGPCAFMDAYGLETVFSSIDRNGRYAYGNQPDIAAWNLTSFAETLLPLLADKEEDAVKNAEAALESFGGKFTGYWLKGMLSKLGLTTETRDDITLFQALLKWMQDHKADYTETFRTLSDDQISKKEIYNDEVFKQWHTKWKSRNPSLVLMKTVNPFIIPRNYRVEEALAAAANNGDYSVMKTLLAALKNPFEDNDANGKFLAPPSSIDPNYKTFCGT